MKRLFIVILFFKTTLVFAQNENLSIAEYKDTLEYDIFHYNKLLGQKLLLTDEGIDYKGERILTDQVYKSSVNGWPSLFDTSNLFKAKNSNSTLIDSLKGKEFLCLGLKEEGSLGYYIKLQNEKTRILVCNFVGKYCPFSTLKEIKSNKAAGEIELSNKKKQDEAENKELAEPCSRIDYEYDEFHYTKKFNTALDLPALIADTSYFKFYDIVFYKEIKKSIPTYYISLQTISSTPLATQKGVIIILNNGKRLNKPLAKVTTEVETIHDESEYVRHSFIQLNQNDLTLLKASPIKEYELYIDQSNLLFSDTVYKMFLCLLMKK